MIISQVCMVLLTVNTFRAAPTRPALSGVRKCGPNINILVQICTSKTG